MLTVDFCFLIGFSYGSNSLEGKTGWKGKEREEENDPYVGFGLRETNQA